MSKVFVTIGLITVLLLGGWLAGAERAFSAGTASLPVTDRELFRNGGFDLGSHTDIPTWQLRGGPAPTPRSRPAQTPRAAPR